MDKVIAGLAFGGAIIGFKEHLYNLALFCTVLLLIYVIVNLFFFARRRKNK